MLRVISRSFLTRISYPASVNHYCTLIKPISSTSILCAAILFTSSNAFAESAVSTITPDTIHCPSFVTSKLNRKASRTSIANPSNWINVIENAIEHEEILLQDGKYDLDQAAVVFRTVVTLRSKSGSRESVIINCNNALLSFKLT